MATNTRLRVRELEKELQIAEENIEFLQEHLVKPERFVYEDCTHCGRFERDFQPESIQWINNEFYCINCYYPTKRAMKKSKKANK